MPQTADTQVSSAKEPAHGELHKKRDDASLGLQVSSRWASTALQVLTCSQDMPDAEEVNEEEVKSLALVITQEDFSTQCLGILCQDKVPSEVSKDLFVALQKYVAMTQEQCGCNFKTAQLGIVTIMSNSRSYPVTPVASQHYSSTLVALTYSGHSRADNLP